jgi:hypothetical protein
LDHRAEDREGIYRDDEPEVERGLLGLEDVEDVGGIVGEVVQRHPHLLLRALHRDVHARHPPVALFCPPPATPRREEIWGRAAAPPGDEVPQYYLGFWAGSFSESE